MIRFPERFHASQTPQASFIGVEPNYLEEPPATPEQQRQRRNVRGAPALDAPRFDFTAINAVLGH